MKAGDKVTNLTRTLTGRVVTKLDGMVLVKWDDEGTCALDREEEFIPI